MSIAHTSPRSAALEVDVSQRHQEFLAMARNAPATLFARQSETPDPAFFDALEESLDNEDSLDAHVKRQLRRAIQWGRRWSPTVLWIQKYYLILSEFGVQMAATIFLAIVLVGLLGYSFIILACAAYALLVVVTFIRYRMVLGFFGWLFATAREEVPSEFLVGIRQAYVKAFWWQAASLFAALVFATRIVGVGANAQIFGRDASELLVDSAENTVAKALASFAWLVVASIFSYLSARGFQGAVAAGPRG
jgi:hypothetical protein